MFIKEHKNFKKATDENLIKMVLKSKKKEIDLPDDIIDYRNAVLTLKGLIEDMKATAKLEEFEKTFIHEK